MPPEFEVFDGHNDVILRLWRGGPEGLEARFAESRDGHLDLARARAGGFVGGFFALFVPDPSPFDDAVLDDPPYDIPLPPPLEADKALRVVIEQASVLHRLDRAGHLRLCRTGAEIEAAIGEGRIAAVMHMEGAEAIDAELAALDALFAMGLRSLGPVWSRPTVFGEGVPFRFPSDGDIGGGLTAAGRRLVARARKLGLVIDTSHLNLRGFHDVAEAGLPVVATHSNAHAIAPSARNLTDDQLRIIGETGGLVGLNFATVFLDPQGRRDPGALTHAPVHLERMIEVAGEDCVGLGSDFDGAPMPDGLTSAADLPNLARTLLDAGFGEELVRRIMGGNWRAFLSRVLR